ncbi:MAG: DUF445 family protein, partial [Pseudomonadales bacterium]|nr:DUF445 family protein [Pseudomonadales bacterium]
EGLVDIKEVLDRVDAQEISDILQPNLKLLVESIMNEVGMQYSAIFWENLPGFAKNRIYSTVARKLPTRINHLISDIRENHENLIDAKSMVINKLDKEKHLLVGLIRKTIDSELSFLIKSGLLLGFLFGIFQMIYFYNYPDSWVVLPLGGFFVGYLTNWVAIKLMFRPLEPKRIGPFLLQGLFIKRKNQVASDYSETLTVSILNARTIAEYILQSEQDTPINNLLRFHIKEAIDEAFGNSKYLVLFSTGTQSYINFKTSFVDSIYGQGVPVPLMASIDYTDKAIDLAGIIESRMKAFTPKELDGFVRPVFEQDEWILYVVGGVLGALAGWGQLVAMFS